MGSNIQGHYWSKDRASHLKYYLHIFLLNCNNQWRLQVHHGYGICLHESNNIRDSIHLDELALTEFVKICASLFYRHVNDAKLASLGFNISYIKFIECKVFKILCWNIKKWLVLERRIHSRTQHILIYDKTEVKL